MDKSIAQFLYERRMDYTPHSYNPTVIQNSITNTHGDAKASILPGIQVQGSRGITSMGGNLGENPSRESTNTKPHAQSTKELWDKYNTPLEICKAPRESHQEECNLPTYQAIVEEYYNGC